MSSGSKGAVTTYPPLGRALKAEHEFSVGHRVSLSHDRTPLSLSEVYTIAHGSPKPHPSFHLRITFPDWPDRMTSKPF